MNNFNVTKSSNILVLDKGEDGNVLYYSSWAEPFGKMRFSFNKEKQQRFEDLSSNGFYLTKVYSCAQTELPWKRLWVLEKVLPKKIRTRIKDSSISYNEVLYYLKHKL